jgi:hypothetical protein
MTIDHGMTIQRKNVVVVVVVVGGPESGAPSIRGLPTGVFSPDLFRDAQNGGP